MGNEMLKMGEKFTNRADNPLKCRMVNINTDKFLNNNIHLTYAAQKDRIIAIRKIYKMHSFKNITLKYQNYGIKIGFLMLVFANPAESS